jgi:hypothetical protein
MKESNDKAAENSPQSARFMEAAKKIGADESGKSFEKAFKKIARKKASKR